MAVKIIFINGASSSGKSTLCKALQAKLEEPFWHFSIDHLREAKVLPSQRIRSGDFAWADMRPAFFEGFHRSLPALAGAGNNLIVEHIIETEAWMRRLLQLLEPFDVFFVGLHCPLPELERREIARGDRRLGEARQDYATAHTFGLYDIEIDSTELLERNVDAVISAWKARKRPSAFDRMAASLSSQPLRSIETTRLRLQTFAPEHLLALIEGSRQFEGLFGMPAAEGLRDFMVSEEVSPAWLTQLRTATTADPWVHGFAVVHRKRQSVIGSAGFTGPPDAEGVVEIAYCIAPGFQGRGYATEAAQALIAFAFGSGCVRRVRAHTLPSPSASTRVLTKCGFERIGEIVDPTDGLIWRWERTGD